ncbi:putative mitochondrial zinc maintenance protein 1, mitochondrial [Pseudovirgaria hyperparasitica]|uniref:Mitochondrial zinc maintenance protein 1, mitochondrial n=1 Tax=Pseudovirgaria hyperparasitica TaxID=470096 RepID=A0A6A6WEU9_9PEZI|nr:putative mitochondrial zinc maintenance protein 1, mitochondrial [Pseudovirgaria hyperparasitica]KAF2761243.1 putative mitochondrial zinc maintenance protein 1, mitochondrial [Pseudovirgaria hyperparasitica]
MALAAYRHVLRSAMIAFKNDTTMLSAARNQARTAFESNRHLSPGTPEFAEQVEHAEGVAQILRQNVVQGKQEEDGRYKLGIHEHTERGDNESIKMPRVQDVKMPRGKTNRPQTNLSGKPSFS